MRTLKEEHSVLKDMVRDLEQMKENEETQIKSTTEKTVVTGTPPTSGGNTNTSTSHQC